jgi:hypothetical protein
VKVELGFHGRATLPGAGCNGKRWWGQIQGLPEKIFLATLAPIN